MDYLKYLQNSGRNRLPKFVLTVLLFNLISLSDNQSTTGNRNCLSTSDVLDKLIEENTNLKELTNRLKTDLQDQAQRLSDLRSDLDNATSRKQDMVTTKVTYNSLDHTTSTARISTIHPTVSIIPGASLNFTFQGEQNLYGYNVYLRTGYYLSGFLRTFIDPQRPLRIGILQKYYFYAPPYQDTRIARVQIWRPNAGSNVNYTLVWQYRIFVEATATGSLYTIRVMDNFLVQTGDFIGFTNENQTSSIIFDVVSGQQTFHRVPPENDQLMPIFPVVGQSYIMESITYPAVFSMAVEIDPRLTGATGVPVFPETD